MEDLSFIDQIRLFAESEIITGPHGAAYSFAVFCQPGTLLFEIYKADNIKGHYPILANECGLQYKRFYGVNTFDEITHDMTINKESYIEELQNLIVFREFSSGIS
jgi:capsular polysaccharide biosynthesis protein